MNGSCHPYEMSHVTCMLLQQTPVPPATACGAYEWVVRAVHVRHMTNINQSWAHVQPIAFGVSFHLNFRSQSQWSLFNGTWQKWHRQLEYRLRFENEEMSHDKFCMYAHIKWVMMSSPKPTNGGDRTKNPHTVRKSSDGNPRIIPHTTRIQCENLPTGIPVFGWRAAAVGLKPLAAARPLRLPKFPANFRWSPRTYQTRFHGGPQDF